MSDKSLISQALVKIKDKHNLTIEQWAEKSGVPKSSVARFMSRSLNLPNFPYVCAMLKCVGESIDEFYDHIDEKIDTPVEAMKLDAVPPQVVGDAVMDVPENKAAMVERIIVQTEAMQAQNVEMLKKDNEIALLEATVDALEHSLAEKEREIKNLEAFNARRLQAIRSLCENI